MNLWKRLLFELAVLGNKLNNWYDQLKANKFVLFCVWFLKCQDSNFTIYRSCGKINNLKIKDAEK